MMLMEVGLVVGVIGFVLVLLLAMGAWKGRVREVFDGLAALSFVYSSLELFRYIVDYIKVNGIAFPSLFHIELFVVAFGPAYLIFRRVRSFLGYD